MAESKEELKSLLMKVKKESEKFVLKLNIQKTKIMTFSPTDFSIIYKMIFTFVSGRTLHVCVCVCVDACSIASVMSDSLQPCGL